MDDSEPGYHSEHTSFVSSRTDHEYISRTDNSEGRTNGDVQETRLVIGLDYGTTYTGALPRSAFLATRLTLRLGVAYATPSGNNCLLEDIDVMVEWGMSCLLPQIAFTDWYKVRPWTKRCQVSFHIRAPTTNGVVL